MKNRLPVSRSMRSRKLGVESLEARRVMAGNVSAFVTGAGDLIVQGDGASNMLAINNGAAAGDVVVTGYIDPTANQLTTINGIATYGPVTLSGFHGSVIVNLGDGDDVLAVHDLDARNLNVSLGSGNDALGLGNYAVSSDYTTRLFLQGQVNVTGDVFLDGGAGNDAITQRLLSVVGNELVLGGDGDDVITHTSSSFTAKEGHLQHALTVLPGSGDDYTTIYGAQIDGTLTVDDSQAVGNAVSHVDVTISVLNDVYIHTSEFSDSVSLRANSMQNVSVYTGSGADLFLADSNLMENLTVDTGAGDEATVNTSSYGVTVSGNQIRTSATILTGDGNDEVLYWNNSGVDRLFADLGTGDDFAVFDSAASIETTVLSGAGNDWLRLGGASAQSLGRTNVQAGDGNDFVWFLNANTTNVAVDTGAGSDTLKVNGSATSVYRVNLGADDDQLTGFFTVNATADSTQSYFDGGAGADHWTQVTTWPYAYSATAFEFIAV